MRLIVAAVAFLFLTAVAMADSSNEVAEIQALIEEIRGKSFTAAITAQNQTLEEFEAYLDRTLAKQAQAGLAGHYETIVRAVGLYTGPPLGDFLQMTKLVMMSLAAAYYDPETEAFSIVMLDLPDMMRRPLFVHELTHGLQDQHHDLDAYLLDMSDGTLNDDELLARQSVVEGEATYVMTVASVKDLMGIVPSRELLGLSIDMQADLSAKQMSGMLDSSPATRQMGGGLAEAAKAIDEIPAFMIETLLGSYLKGQAFVYAVQAGGWGAVDSLFIDPPVSTEQILHPDKYIARELPRSFDLNSLDNRLFDGWTHLHTNVMGELQWRVVFDEHGLGDLAKSASDGWDGDAYAVYQDDDGATLMLMATHWDTDKDADVFEAAYQGVIDAKGGHGDVTRLMLRDRRFVGIVEGGDSRQAANRLEAMKSLAARP